MGRFFDPHLLFHCHCLFWCFVLVTRIPTTPPLTMPCILVLTILLGISKATHSIQVLYGGRVSCSWLHRCWNCLDSKAIVGFGDCHSWSCLSLLWQCQCHLYAHQSVQYDYSKHSFVAFHFDRSQVATCDLIVCYITTSLHIVDMFMKGLSSKQYFRIHN